MAHSPLQQQPGACGRARPHPGNKICLPRQGRSVTMTSSSLACPTGPWYSHQTRCRSLYFVYFRREARLKQSNCSPGLVCILVIAAIFLRSCGAAQTLQDGNMEWGKYSEESTYVTMGRPPATSAASQAWETVQGGKKGRKRETSAAKKNNNQQGVNGSAEISPAEAKRRLQVRFVAWTRAPGIVTEEEFL